MPPAPTPRQPAYWTVAGLMVIAYVILSWPWVSGRWVVPWDALAHFQAQFDFLARSFGRGESPNWNPYVFSGWPQIADPQSLIFIPAYFILALFDHAPSFEMMEAAVYFELGLGGLALLGFFHDRGWHKAGGAVAAITFAFGGAAAWRIQHTGQILSIAVLPLVLFLLNRALMRSSILWGLLAGVAAARLAIGRDQVALLGIYFLTGFVIVHLFGATPATRIKRGFLPLVAGAVSGLVVAIVPVALTYILAQESNRPVIDYAGAGIASMHPASFITFVNADLFSMRLHSTKIDYWGPPSEVFKEFFSDKPVTLYIARNMAEVYSGMIPAFAILMWGIARGKMLEREIRYMSFALLFACLYTIGWYTPAFRAFYDFMPGVSLYRRPADATFHVGFFVSIVGGYLVHRWMSRDWGPTGVAARIAQVGIGLLVLVIIPYWIAVHADRVAVAIRPSAETIILWFAAAIILFATLWLNYRSKLAAVALIAAFTTADLAYQIAPNESTAADPTQFEAIKFNGKDPTVKFLQEHIAADQSPQVRDRVELVGLGFHWPNASMVQGFENTLGYNPLRLKIYQEAVGARDHVAVPEQRDFSAPLFPSYHSLMADMLGLKWIAVGVPVGEIDKRLKPGDLKLVSSSPGAYLYENPNALPRVLFVPDAQAVDFNQIVASGKWPDGFDPRKTVLVDKSALPVPPGAPVSGDVDLSKAASIDSYRNTEIDISTRSPVAGYLVLNDTFHRWWKVTIDGQPATMLRANVIFRAVAVPAGEHKVSFTFHPFTGAFADIKAIITKGKDAAPLGPASMMNTQ